MVDVFALVAVDQAIDGERTKDVTSKTATTTKAAKLAVVK